MRAIAGALLMCFALAGVATAQPTPPPGNGTFETAAPAENVVPESWAIHGQSTTTWQGNSSFPAAYSGANSLSSHANGRETFDATLFVGVRLWSGMEVWADPEVDQGFGLANTLGLAGFSSAEAYKVGNIHPYFRLQRLFGRQTIDLGGEAVAVDPDLNVLGGATTSNRIVITGGKLSAADIFDTNEFAHDPRSDFLNWSIVDTGSWDYAADAWGYTYGAAIEWYQDWWTIRAGLFDLSTVSNSTDLDPVFISQTQTNIELEERHLLFGQRGTLKLLFYLDRGRLGAYTDAVALARASGTVPNVSNVLNYRSKTGLSLNLGQKITDDIGVFARAGWSQGSIQAYDFTDVVNSFSAGTRVKGALWGREHDEFGFAVAVNASSRQSRQYFNAGGLGILVGDGQLPRASTEQIVETYYNIGITDGVVLTPDFQYIKNPAYSVNRGPVAIFAARFHVQF